MYVKDRDACLCGEESEGTGEGVRTQFEFIKGLLIDIDSTDVITHQYTQVNGFVGKREGLPGNRVGPGEGFESVSRTWRILHFSRFTPKPEMWEKSSIWEVKDSIPSSVLWANTASSA